MSRAPIPLSAVRALFLKRQHLVRPRAFPLSAPRLLHFVEDVGGLQLDSINVLDRAHYLAVWARFGPYDRARLDRLVYRRRLLFEYWAHAACLVPTATLPWWRRAMLDYRVRHTGWSGWLRRNTRVVARVKSVDRRQRPDGQRGLRAAARGRAERLVGLESRPARAALPVDDRHAHDRVAAPLPQALRPARARHPGVGGGRRCRARRSRAGTSSARSTRWGRPRKRTCAAISRSRGSRRARAGPRCAR